MSEWAVKEAQALASCGDPLKIAEALDEAYARGQADKVAEFVALIETAKAAISGISHYEIGLSKMAGDILAKLLEESAPQA